MGLKKAFDALHILDDSTFDALEQVNPVTSIKRKMNDPKERAKTFGTDEWLEAEFANSGLDPSYHDRWMSNPYIDKYRELFNSDEGALTDLSRGLFGTSSYDRNLIQAKADVRSYMSDLINQKGINDYNSEEEKTKRMMAAGQNPNLLGTGDVANDVGNPEPAFGSPLESSQSDVSAVTSLYSCVGSVMDFVSSVVSVANGFQSLRGQRLTNEGLEIDNRFKGVQTLASVRDLGNQVALYSITEDDFKPKSEGRDIDFPSTLVTQYADMYFPKSSDKKQLQLRDAFLRSVNDSRASIINKHKTFEDFQAYRAGLASPLYRNYDGYTLLQDELFTADYYDAKVKAALAVFEADLMDDEKVIQLMRDSRFSGLTAQVAKNKTAEKQATVDQLELDIEQEVLTEGRDDIEQASIEQFRVLLKQYAAAKANAALLQTSYEIRSAYLARMQQNGFTGQLYYRPLSPERELYKEAKGVDGDPSGSVMNGVGFAVDAFLKLISIGM